MALRSCSLAVAAALTLACASTTPPPRASAPPPVPRPPAPAVVEPPAPPPHPDFAKLRRHHNYYRVLSVGALRHHFVAFYDDWELVTERYDAPVDGGVVVRARGGSSGLVTTEPPPEPVPAGVAKLAAAVEQDVRRTHPRTHTVHVHYLGKYREVVVEEIVVRQPEPAIYEYWTLRSTLAVDDGLTSIGGVVRYAFDSGGSLALGKASEHPDTPNWIDADVGRAGTAQLWDLVHDDSPLFAPAVRKAFGGAVLAAARRVVDGRAGLLLEELASERDARLLPAGIDDARRISFVATGVKPRDGRHEVEASAWIDPARAFGGSARARLRLDVPTDRGAVHFEADVVLRGEPIPAGAHGDVELPLTIDTVLSAAGVVPAATMRKTETVTAHVVVDGDRLYVEDLPRSKPAALNLPAVSPWSELAAFAALIDEM